MKQDKSVRTRRAVKKHLNPVEVCGVAQSRSKPEENHTNRLQLYPTGDSQSHVAEEEQQGEKNQDALFNLQLGHVGKYTGVTGWIYTELPARIQL